MNDIIGPEMMPSSNLQTMPWFHGSISREESEKSLSRLGDGWYLVRESAHFAGDFTLSVHFAKRIEHYRVEKTPSNKLTIDNDSYFDNLIQLVEHYQRDADGLCCQLLRPVTNSDFVNSRWKIPYSDLKFEELIGKGEFSEVHKALYRSKAVAVKVIRCGKTAMEPFMAEAALMSHESMNHANLVQMLGVVVEEDKLCLVMEHMSKGSLVEYLRTRGRAVIQKEDQLKFAKDCCNGMEHLEKMNIVHRDLAARNVLLDDNGKAKVSDFGLAVHSEVKHSGDKIPIKWTAPEALKDKKMFTSKSDVWSFGILLWEIYSFGRVPYPKTPLAGVISYIEQGSRMEQPDGCPPDVYQVMQQTWNIDPHKRPSFAQLKQTFVDLCSTPV